MDIEEKQRTSRQRGTGRGGRRLCGEVLAEEQDQEKEEDGATVSFFSSKILINNIFINVKNDK